MLKALSWWWNHDAEWWQFWFPCSGAGGGLIMGTLVFIFGCLTGLATYRL